MKVGIITFSHGYNYGAILQCLALYRAIQHLNVKVDVIRYIPPDGSGAPAKTWRGWRIRQGIGWQHFRRKCVSVRYGSKLARHFDDFRYQYLSFSPKCTTNEQVAAVAKEYDALICGSDQVWHFARKGPFFLNWGIPYSGRRISYAACCGTLDQPDMHRAEIGDWIQDFDFVSVRNDFSKEIVRDVSGREPEVVADPTLLVDMKDIQKRPADFPYNNYILVYIIGNEIKGGHIAAIKAIKKKVGNLPVVAVVSSVRNPQWFPWADLIFYTAGPTEWLYLLVNASFIYTDSFHGALFSINNHLPFLVYYVEQWRAPRLIDIKKRYLLDQAVIGSVDEAIEKLDKFPLNYKTIDERIDKHVQESLAYLKQSLDGIV